MYEIYWNPINYKYYVLKMLFHIVKPWPQTLCPKPLSPKPKIKGPWADTKMLEATTTHPPPNFRA